VRRLRPELWRQISWPHFLFRQAIFDQNNATFLFPRLKIKLKGGHFDTVQVMEAKSQAVLNTLTEHDLQDAFKKWQKRWERRMHAGEGYFEGAGGQ
jgi:hypothetical protein